MPVMIDGIEKTRCKQCMERYGGCEMCNRGYVPVSWVHALDKSTHGPLHSKQLGESRPSKQEISTEA